MVERQAQMSRVATFVAVLGMFLHPMLASGQAQLQFTGIPAAELNELAQPQEQSEWCWAESIRLALGCYHVNLSQDQISARTHGLGWNGQAINQPGTNDDITRNLAGWGIDAEGKHYTVGCVVGQGLPNAAGLISVLAAKHPVILAIDNGAGGGHAIVCTAVGYVDTPAGPLIQELIVRDPWPYPSWENTHGRYEMPASNAVKIVRGFWVVNATTENEETTLTRANKTAKQLSADGENENRDGYNKLQARRIPAPDTSASNADRIVILKRQMDRFSALATKYKSQADDDDNQSAAAMTDAAQARYRKSADRKRKLAEKYQEQADDLDEKITALNADGTPDQ